MRKRIIFICFLVLTLLWVSFIFANSLDSGAESGEKSSAVTSTVNKTLHKLGIKASISEKAVRTLAHFMEFAVLGAFVSTDIVLSPLPRKFKQNTRLVLPLFAVPICFCVACIDELIQNFSAGRAMQFSDVLVDTLGALSLSIVFSLVLLIVSAVKSRTK